MLIVAHGEIVGTVSQHVGYGIHAQVDVDVRGHVALVVAEHFLELDDGIPRPLLSGDGQDEAGGSSYVPRAHVVVQDVQFAQDACVEVVRDGIVDVSDVHHPLQCREKAPVGAAPGSLLVFAPPHDVVDCFSLFHVSGRLVVVCKAYKVTHIPSYSQCAQFDTGIGLESHVAIHPEDGKRRGGCGGRCFVTILSFRLLFNTEGGTFAADSLPNDRRLREND